MDYLIAPALFLNNTCRLPGIGRLHVISKPAEKDIVNFQIKAPVQFITFYPDIVDDNFFNEFTALSTLIKKDLDQNGKVILKSIGYFLKEEGGIKFMPLSVNPDFIPNVAAIRISRPNVSHDILVGDKQTTSVQMTEYFDDDSRNLKDRWWIWAIILFVVGIAVLVGYSILYGFNSLGNMMPH